MRKSMQENLVRSITQGTRMKKNSKFTKVELIHPQVGEGIVTYLALKLKKECCSDTESSHKWPPFSENSAEYGF